MNNDIRMINKQTNKQTNINKNNKHAKKLNKYKARYSASKNYPYAAILAYALSPEMFVRENAAQSTITLIRNSTIAEAPHVSGTLQWRLSKIACSWTI